MKPIGGEIIDAKQITDSMARALPPTEETENRWRSLALPTSNR